MKYRLCGVFAALCLAGTSMDTASGGEAADAATSHSPTEIDATSRQQAAVDAIQALGKELKAALQAAVREGGAVGAIGICHEKAAAISARISAEKGLHVARTSLRPRNPKNAPLEWQEQVLQRFEDRRKAGEDPEQLTYSAVVATAAGREHRFMKAIPTGMICLNCHGTALDAEVQKRLAELYPYDRATGFKEGDLRGAFVVTRLLLE
jgi:hypothetical protein